MKESDSLPYQVPTAKGTRVLYVGKNGLVALEKPGGVLSTPNNPSDLNKTLIRAKFSKKEEAYVWFDAEQQKRYFYICHRLDSPTSGILLGTVNDSLATKIRAMFKARRIQKTYIALVHGIPRDKKGIWEDRLKSNQGGKGTHVRTAIGQGGDASVTFWKTLQTEPKKRLSLLEMQPHTGRTHQLRVQSSFRKLPILGDRTYGDFKHNAHAKKEWGVQRLMLHAHKVEIKDPEPGLNITIESPIPPEFFHLFDN